MRRAKPQPAILRIESMSTGQPIDTREPQWDDFTGEPIALKALESTRPVAPLPSAQDIIDEANRRRAQAAQARLEAVGILRPNPKPKPQGHTQTRIVVNYRRSEWRRI
jgi:hypothetical protein